MIKDVSRQYAAFFTEAKEEDEKYSNACAEACKEAEELKKQEIDDMDEEEIRPEDCGFSEEEIQAGEVVDPMQIWKESKVNEENKQELVKVDNNYINKMKKLLSGIRSSKKAIYDRICGSNGKLQQYMKAGTMLPPPEDFAENFVPFEEIQKIMSKFKGDDEDDQPHDNEADTEGTEGHEIDVDNRAAEEFKDVGDADSGFGSFTDRFGQDANDNLYDCELTEEEEEEAKEKAKDQLEKAKSKVKDVDAEAAADFLKKNGSKIKDAISKVKNEKTKEDLKKIMKAVEKYSKGELDESMIGEAASSSKKGGKVKETAKKIKESSVSQFIKASLRLLTWFLMIVPMGLLGSAWVLKGLGKATGGLLDKMNKNLKESLDLEIADDEEAEANEDEEELDETGCKAKLKEDGEEEKKDDVDEAACCVVDDPASHLLDKVGVKASTANLVGNDAAAISVVERLLSKIDKLESKIEILESRAEKNSDDATTSKSVKFEAEGDGEDPETFEVSKEDLEDSKMKFRSDLDKLSRDQLKKLFDQLADRIETSLENQRRVNPDPSVKHTQKEINDAVKKINFYRRLSYAQELTDAQKKEFADLVYKYWYDWVCVEKKDEDGETYWDPVVSVSDMLNQPFKSFFGRPGDKVTLATDFKIWDNGNVYTLQPFNYTLDVDDYKQRKSIEKRKQRMDAQAQRDAADAGKGFVPKRGQAGTWSINDWNRMIGSLSDGRRREIKDEIMADINDELKDNPQERAREIALIQSLFNGTAKVVDANKSRISKIDKQMKKKRKQLKALQDKMQKEIDDLDKQVGELEKVAKAAKEKLDADPDNEDLDVDYDNAKFDLDQARQEMWDKVEELRDMADNADDYLDQMDVPDDGDDDKDDPKSNSPMLGADGNLHTQDKGKEASISAKYYADMWGVSPQAARKFARSTIDMILLAMSQATGTKDPDKLKKSIAEMTPQQWSKFIKLLGEYSDKRKRGKIMSDEDTTEDTNGILSMFDRSIRDGIESGDIEMDDEMYKRLQARHQPRVQHKPTPKPKVVHKKRPAGLM